jgi:photosystem II stability/assembly factor-like uncharacterized protein
MPSSQETLIEQVVLSSGCRRTSLALASLAGIVIVTLLLGMSFLPAWEGAGDPMLHPLAILVDPAQPITIYAGTEQGIIMVSRDNGATWISYHAGLPAGTVIASLLAVRGTGHLLAGTNHGIFASLDGGHHWTATGSGLPATLTVDALVALPPDARTLLAGGTTGLYRSTDGGQTWSSSTEGLPDSSAVYGLDVLPGHIFAGHIFAALIPGGVYASTDGGATWSSSGRGLPAGVNAFAVVHASSTHLYVGTSAGIFRSTDGGMNWSASSTGLGSANRAISLAVDPLQSEHVVAGTDTGVFRSDDSGATWSRLGGLPAPPGQSIGVVVLTHPATGTTVYYAAADHLYRYPQAPHTTKSNLQWIGIAADLALFALLVLLGVQSFRVTH